jgi:hypothetical protein
MPVLGEQVLRILQAEIVVDRMAEFLLAAQVTLGRLNRCVAEQELDLFQLSARQVAQPGARAPQIMRGKVLDVSPFRSTLHNMPYRLRSDRGTQSLPMRLTRRKIVPALMSPGLRRPVSQASNASLRTAANRKLIVEGARFFCSRKNRYRRTIVRLNARRGSEQYQPINSSIAWPYDSCELAAASEFNTAFFDCSRSGSRSTVLGLDRFRYFLPTCDTGGLLRHGFQYGGLTVAMTRTPFSSTVCVLVGATRQVDVTPNITRVIFCGGRLDFGLPVNALNCLFVVNQRLIPNIADQGRRPGSPECDGVGAMADGEDAPKGFGPHSDQEPVLEEAVSKHCNSFGRG